MLTLLRLSLCAVLVSACGGGGGNNNQPGGGGGSGFSARIDGRSWQGAPNGVTAAAVSSVPGALVVVGSQTFGGVTRSLTLSLYNISGPGTYPLGMSSDVFGGIGQVGEGRGGGKSHASCI